MRKLIALGVLAVFLAGTAGLTQMTYARNGNGNGKGAVRVDLWPRSDNPDQDSSGWAVLNTTSEGYVKANVHIDGATPGDEHAVILVVEGVWDEDNFLTIKKNGKGVGADLEMVPMALYDDAGFPLPPGTVTVRLAVRPAAGSSAQGWTSDEVELPLKVLD